MMDPHYEPEKIAIIGGGISGALTALMLAKHKNPDGTPKYHITVLEKEPALFSGSSMLASRLHLGGEYPNDDITANHCLDAAILWKLLMPDSIYTPVPPINFTLAKQTEEEGRANPSDANSLTLEKQRASYEKIRALYEKRFKQIRDKFKWSDEETAKALFGSYEKGKFYRELSQQDCEALGYSGDIGGIATQELGLNVPKYLAMLEQALRSQANITVHTGAVVNKNGITGSQGNFTIQYQNSKDKDAGGKNALKASQVVLAAYQHGPSIWPKLAHPGNIEQQMDVYKRAMLMIELPEGMRFKNPGVFRLKGSPGCMFNPYNGKTAVCYVPSPQGAYVDDRHNSDNPKPCSLNMENPILPAGWEKLPKDKQDKHAWTRQYFHELTERLKFLQDIFPDVDEAIRQGHIKLVIRDTINFQKSLQQRRDHGAQEAIAGFAPPSFQGIAFQSAQEMLQDLEITHDIKMKPWDRNPIIEVEKGLFTLYPTKLTYGISTALQADHLVCKRSKNRKANKLSSPSNTLEILFDNEPQKSLARKEFFSLAGLKPATETFQKEFLKRHPELPPAILDTCPLDLPPETPTTQMTPHREPAHAMAL